MNCRCGSGSEVIDSRSTVFRGSPCIRRRRQCKQCHCRWTTYEIELAREIVDRLLTVRHCLNDVRTQSEYAIAALEALEER